jgi:hypothetical protein
MDQELCPTCGYYPAEVSHTCHVDYWYMHEQAVKKLKTDSELLLRHREELMQMLQRFVPNSKTVQWEQREIEARDLLERITKEIGGQ